MTELEHTLHKRFTNQLVTIDNFKRAMEDTPDDLFSKLHFSEKAFMSIYRASMGNVPREVQMVGHTGQELNYAGRRLIAKEL